MIAIDTVLCNTAESTAVQGKRKKILKKDEMLRSAMRQVHGKHCIVPQVRSFVYFFFLFVVSPPLSCRSTPLLRLERWRPNMHPKEVRCVESDVKTELKDVRVPSKLPPFKQTSCDTTTAIFSSHRFILVSRSPYFLNALSWSYKQQPGDEPPTLNLPSPPFTPASLHFTLGFMYTRLSSFLIVHMIYPPLSPSSEPRYISHLMPFMTKPKPE
jgi:hypothetical protein